MLWFTLTCELLRPLVAILAIGLAAHLGWRLLAWIGHQVERLVD